LRDHGIGHFCGQFFGGSDGTPCGLLDPDLDTAGIARVREILLRHGLKIASFNADGDFMLEKGVGEQVDGYCRAMDKAAALKAQTMIAFAGWQARDDDAIYRQVAAALKQAARHAAGHKMTVALENHGGLTATAAQIDRLLDLVDEPNIGVNYDPANFLMYGTDPLQALQELRHPVIFTHLKSLKHVRGKKVYCRVKEGEIDYAPILAELRRRNYAGFWGLEYEETADVLAGSEDDLNALRPLISRNVYH